LARKFSVRGGRRTDLAFRESAPDGAELAEGCPMHHAFRTLAASCSLLACLGLTGLACWSAEESDADDEDAQDLEEGLAGCKHDVCTTGIRLRKNCDPCVKKICAADAYCCSTAWDADCVDAAATLCGQTCGGSAASSGDATTGSTSGDTTGSTSGGSTTAGSTSGGSTSSSSSGGGGTGLDAEELAFLSIINDYRAQNGLGALSACTSLGTAAQLHSEDMRDNDYFSHTGLNGSSPWDRSCAAGYQLGCGPQTAMGENLAAGNSLAPATFTQWKNSPGHNANMLGGSFTVIGIGRATGGGTYGSYWTTVFGGATEASCN
jgi:uncharacterized protein YkwD